MKICMYFLHPPPNFHKCLVQKMPTEIQWFQFHALRRTGGDRLHSSASEILFGLSTFVVSFGWNLRKIVEIKLYLLMGCKWNDTPRFNVEPFNAFCLQRVGTYSRTHQQATSFSPICWQQRWTWKDSLVYINLYFCILYFCLRVRYTDLTPAFQTHCSGPSVVRIPG
jgi:hypothetical protein